MKKILLPLLVIAALLVAIIPPQPAEASRVDEINKRLKELEQKAKQSESTKNKAVNEIRSITRKEKEVTKEINFLNEEIKKTKASIVKKKQEIAETTVKLQNISAELDEAEQRVEERDALLRSRIRLMYTNGAVSYLDVLLSATSFADFLDRYRSLSQIVDQDKGILEDNLEDKKIIAETKQAIETDFANLELAYKDLEEQEKSLVAKEQSKEVMIAQLNERKEDLEDISEEQEKALTDFLTESSRLLAERTKLTAKKHSGKYAWPLPDAYRISSNFGYRTHPVTKKKKLHTGTDIAAPSGTDVLAAGNGVVITAKFWGGYGNAVVIDHLNGQWTLYAHMSKIRVKEGQNVKMHDHIGDVGTTGTSTGPHLHFEVRINSEPVDAMKYTVQP